MPCSSCVEAKAECRTTSIPQKRGPRPRTSGGSSSTPTPTPLERRLAHLENLLASIPHDTVESATGLSDAEKKEIHRTGKGPTPEDGAEPGDDAWNGSSFGTAGPNSMNLPGPHWSNPIGSEPGPSASMTLPPAGGPYAQFGQQPLPYPAPTFPNLTNQPDVKPFIDTGRRPSMTALAGETNPAVAGSSTSSRRNLIYRDKADQLKFLGPSSGLPLLGLLKELKISSTGGADVPAEAWDQQPSASTLDPADLALTTKLWARASAVLPSELMHELIRGYFNVSHLLWPVLNLTTFLQTYLNPATAPPDFIPLVLSMCCLSSRSLDSPLLSPSLAPHLFKLCRHMLREDLAGRTTLPYLCALFNLAVYAEGTEAPSRSLLLLSQAVTLAVDMGLHRRVDDWDGFNRIELEVRKRLFWAIYCMSVKACGTFGRPPMIRLIDVDVPEPVAVDDAYLTADSVGVQPLDKPSIQAGFVAAIRLHMLLERVLEVINSVNLDPLDASFASLVLDSSPPTASFPSDELINTFARDLPGEWTFTPTAINDSDTVRFFQRTRAYALQQFIRLLVARHKLLFNVEEKATSDLQAGAAVPGATGELESITLQQITQAALGIVGCYATIRARGRLRFFGVHAISQLTQAGSSLISVILHTQGAQGARERQLSIVASEGLAGCIGVLRHLGERRPAGTRSADILEEFSRAPGVTAGGSPAYSGSGMTPDDGSNSASEVPVPNVRPLTHRETIRRTAPVAAQLPLLDSSTLSWMLEAAISPSTDYGYAFRPPPRFEVDAAGGWAQSSAGASPAHQDSSMSSGMSPATWNAGDVGGTDYGWNGSAAW